MRPRSIISLSLVSLLAVPLMLSACGPEQDDDTVSVQGAIATTTAPPPPPPEIAVKLNHNLKGLTKVLLPAIANKHHLNGTDLKKFTILKDTTKADLGWLGDILFACHDDTTPIVFDIRDLRVDMGITGDAVKATIDGTSSYQHHISIDGDLPGFELDGKLFFDWPATNDGILCTFANNFHYEIPFSIRGATMEASARFQAEGGKLMLKSFDFWKLAATDVSIDNDTLDLLSDIGLGVTDSVVSAFQRLQEGLLSVNLQPEDGICNTAGSHADLEACVGSLASAYVAQEMAKPESDLWQTIYDALTVAMPPAKDVTVDTASFSVAPYVKSYWESDVNNNATVNMTLVPTSSAPADACATGVTMPPPRGIQGTFDAQRDVDLVIPFDYVETVLYQIARQGVFCRGPFPMGSGTAKIDSNGPVKISDQPVATGIANPNTAATSTTTAASTSGSAATSGASTSRTMSSATSTGGGTTTGAVMTGAPTTGVATTATTLATPPVPVLDFYTTNPMRVTLVGTPNGALNITAELGWQVLLTCKNELVLQLVTATRKSASGSITIGGKVLPASDPLVTLAIDAQLAQLPASVPPTPLGPSVTGMPAGTYLVLDQVAASYVAIEAGLEFRNSAPAACAPSGDAPGPVGDDNVDGNEPGLGFEPGTLNTGTGTTTGTGTVGGAGPGAATTQSSTGGSGSTSSRP